MWGRDNRNNLANIANQCNRTWSVSLPNGHNNYCCPYVTIQKLRPNQIKTIWINLKFTETATIKIIKYHTHRLLFVKWGVSDWYPLRPLPNKIIQDIKNHSAPAAIYATLPQLMARAFSVTFREQFCKIRRFANIRQSLDHTTAINNSPRPHFTRNFIKKQSSGKVFWKK